jgi:hypothetical protein
MANPILASNNIVAPSMAAPGLSSFRSATMKQISSGPAFTFTSLGQTQQFRVPSVGYLARVRLLVSGNITIPSSPVGNWISYPFLPYGLFSNVTLQTSENANLINCSGLGLFAKGIRSTIATNALADPISVNNSANRASLLTIPSGALVAGVIPFNALLTVSNMTDDMSMLGLLNAQTIDTSIYLNVTLANVLTTGATVPSAVNLTVTPVFEFFSVPNPQIAQQPDQNFAHTYIEEFYPISSNGNIQYHVPIGPIYMSLCGMLENNGAPLPPANIQSVQMTYASTITPYNEPYAAHVGRYKDVYGQVLPDGMINYDQTLGSGLPQIDNNRDLINTSQQSDLLIQLGLSGVTWVNGGLRIWKEALVTLQ